MAEPVRELIQAINRNAGVTARQLATSLNVSERTVRTYVKRANERLEGSARILRMRDGGYHLIIDDEEAFTRLISAPHDGSIRFGRIPQSHAERVRFLIDDLLSRDTWITVEDLAGMVYVSSRTLSDDLHVVDRELARYDLVLERRPHYGMRVAGTEANRRLCLAGNVVDGMLRPLVRQMQGESGRASDTKVQLSQISACVHDVLADERFEISSFAYQNLIVHVAVMLQRASMDCFIPPDSVPTEQFEGSKVYRIARHLAQRLEECFAIRLPREEAAYLAIHLEARQMLQGYDSVPAGQQLIISDDVWDAVTEMLTIVRDAFHHDFIGDLELRMNLAQHLAPLMVRLSYNLHVENPLVSDIREKYPLAWAMAVEAAAVLEHRVAMPSNEEIGYIALAFALALERGRVDRPKKNILIVCASGRGSARLLEHRYLQEFGDCLGSVQTCDVLHLGGIDFSRIDYVFSTVPLKHSLPVPVREVGFFLDERDVLDVRRVLLDEARPMSDASVFLPELFFPHCVLRSREDALDLLCERVAACLDVPGVDPAIRSLVTQREQMASTAYGNQVAMPHPLMAATDRTVVAVMLLDEPIDWGTMRVRVVFLICVARRAGPTLDGFYGRLTDLAIDKQAIEDLLERQTYEELLRVFGRNEKGVRE